MTTRNGRPAREQELGAPRPQAPHVGSTLWMVHDGLDRALRLSRRDVDDVRRSGGWDAGKDADDEVSVGPVVVRGVEPNILHAFYLAKAEPPGRIIPDFWTTPFARGMRLHRFQTPAQWRSTRQRVLSGEAGLPSAWPVAEVGPEQYRLLDWDDPQDGTALGENRKAGMILLSKKEEEAYVGGAVTVGDVRRNIRAVLSDLADWSQGEIFDAVAEVHLIEDNQEEARRVRTGLHRPPDAPLPGAWIVGRMNGAHALAKMIASIGATGRLMPHPDSEEPQVPRLRV